MRFSFLLPTFLLLLYAANATPVPPKTLNRADISGQASGLTSHISTSEETIRPPANDDSQPPSIRNPAKKLFYERGAVFWTEITSLKPKPTIVGDGPQPVVVLRRESDVYKVALGSRLRAGVPLFRQLRPTVRKSLFKATGSNIWPGYEIRLDKVYDLPVNLAEYDTKHKIIFPDVMTEIDVQVSSSEWGCVVWANLNSLEPKPISKFRSSQQVPDLQPMLVFSHNYGTKIVMVIYGSDLAQENSIFSKIPKGYNLKRYDLSEDAISRYDPHNRVLSSKDVEILWKATEKNTLPPGWSKR